MPYGRDELVTMLKRLDGRLIPEIGNDRITDYEAMRIILFSDMQVTERVMRRFETYGVGMSRSGAGGATDTSRLGGDPLVRARAQDVYFQAVSRNHITLQLVERILKSLSTTRGRKSMILVSEGFIYDPSLSEFKDVVDAARRANVVIYFLDTRGLGGLPAYMGAEFGPALDARDVGFAFGETMEAGEGAESIALDSGGFAVSNTNDLAAGIKRIAAESQSYHRWASPMDVGGTEVPQAGGEGQPQDVRCARKATTRRATRKCHKTDEADDGHPKGLDCPHDSRPSPAHVGLRSRRPVGCGGGRRGEHRRLRLRRRTALRTPGFLLVAHRETGEFSADQGGDGLAPRPPEPDELAPDRRD
jgi:hypothetical protein